MSPPPSPRVLLALLTIYVVWGSTYLAIRVAVETLPPLSMAAVRFLVAGTLLFVWSWARGAALPRREHMAPALVLGALLLLGGNGAVVVAETRISSGLAALLVATEPLVVALLLLAGPRRLRGEEAVRPTPATFVALGLGFLGAGLLVAPGDLGRAQDVHLPSALLVLGGGASWAVGSLYGRRAASPSSPLMASAIQMLAGGACLALAGGLRGEWQATGGAFSLRSLLALGYLIVFGSLVAFTAYSWLVRNADPNRVATYAYVNPLIAVLLGAWLLDEPIGPRTVVAGVLVVGSVAAVVGGERRARGRRPPPIDEVP